VEVEFSGFVFSIEDLRLVLSSSEWWIVVCVFVVGGSSDCGTFDSSLLVWSFELSFFFSCCDKNVT